MVIELPITHHELGVIINELNARIGSIVGEDETYVEELSSLVERLTVTFQENCVHLYNVHNRQSRFKHCVKCAYQTKEI